MFGQSRIIFAMGRDKLLPPVFNAVHPTFRTPFFSTIFFGILIAFVAAFTDINTVGSLTNMGTLFAFILTSLAIPVLRKRYPQLRGAFTVPGGPYLIPVLSALAAFGLILFLKVGNPAIWGFFPLPWLGFIVWLIVGLFLYFSYGRSHSTVGKDG
jgi:APA family basic amino acid/polyamine antiporter